MSTFDPLSVIVWHGLSEWIEAEFRERFGAEITCEAYSPKRQLAIRRCRLVSHVYATVDLEMEQIEMIMRHLPRPATAESVFAMAHGLADGLEGLIFDPTTNRMTLPPARLKEVSA